LHCDESAATGESKTSKKSLKKDFIILSGSKIIQGVAKVYR
jgi:Ca2+-transporting ATPase